MAEGWVLPWVVFDRLTGKLSLGDRCKRRWSCCWPSLDLTPGSRNAQSGFPLLPTNQGCKCVLLAIQNGLPPFGKLTGSHWPWGFFSHSLLRQWSLIHILSRDKVSPRRSKREEPTLSSYRIAWFTVRGCPSSTSIHDGTQVQVRHFSWHGLPYNLSVLCVNADWGMRMKHPPLTMISVLFCLVGLEDGCQSSVKLYSKGIPICLRGSSFFKHGLLLRA